MATLNLKVELSVKQQAFIDKLSNALAEDRIDLGPGEVICLVASYLDDRAIEHADKTLSEYIE